MIKVIIVDDEQLSVNELKYLLKNDEDIDIIGAYIDPKIAVKNIKKLKPDVAFIDISMPEINGFQIAREIIDEGLSTFVVFVTAYNEHALNAFDLEALDYIVKPFSEKRVDKTIKLIKKRLSYNNSQFKYASNDGKHMMQRMFIWDYDSIRIVQVSEIYFFEVVGKKTYVHTKDNIFQCNYSLKALEEKFDRTTFFRCYRNFIVNLNYIERIIPMFNQTYIIKMKNMPKEIPMSRHYSLGMKRIMDIK